MISGLFVVQVDGFRKDHEGVSDEEVGNVFGKEVVNI